MSFSNIQPSRLTTVIKAKLIKSNGYGSIDNYRVASHKILQNIILIVSKILSKYVVNKLLKNLIIGMDGLTYFSRPWYGDARQGYIVMKKDSLWRYSKREIVTIKVI